VTASIDGLEAILKRMETLKNSSKVAVMRSAIRAGLNVIGKQMKADVDPQVKLGRKGVKSRFKKGKFKITVMSKAHKRFNVVEFTFWLEPLDQFSRLFFRGRNNRILSARHHRLHNR